MDYQWLLFDADGTLFDYDAAEVKALSGTFKQMGLLYTDDVIDIYHKINLGLWKQFEAGTIKIPELTVKRFADLFRALGFEADSVQFNALYLDNLGSCADLIEGAEEVVRTLEKQYNLAIITNGIARVQRPRLARSPFADVFKYIAISEEIGISKPDPGYFAAAFEHIGNPPRDEVLIIGDSLTSDIQGGNNYGVDVCWFNPRGLQPGPQYRIKYEIADLRELLTL